MSILNTILNKAADSVSSKVAERIFGTIAQSALPGMGGYDFYPIDGDGGIIGSQISEPVWLGLTTPEKQFWAYRYCSPLSAVIDRYAEADCNGKLQFKNSEMATIKKTKSPLINRVMNLLLKPNPMQTWHEFNAEQVVLSKIYGYAIVFFVCPAGMDKTYSKAAFNLDPRKCQPIRNNDFSFEECVDKNSSYIKAWRIQVGTRDYVTVDANDILVIKDSYVSRDEYNLPMSKIEGLEYAISNICAAMEADNVLLKKKGPLGIFSFDPKSDIGGIMPFNNDDKKELQSDLSQYGLSLKKLQYVISKLPLKWNPTSFNVKDLMTKETIKQSIEAICDRIGYPAELMSGKNATYENRSSSEKYLYLSQIIPSSSRRMAAYNEFFSLDENGDHLSMDYDHLPILQDDLAKAGEARKNRSMSLQIDWREGIITYNEYRLAQGYDSIPGMDIYYSEYLKKYPNETSSKNTGTEKKDGNDVKNNSSVQ